MAKTTKPTKVAKVAKSARKAAAPKVAKANGQVVQLAASTTTGKVQQVGDGIRVQFVGDELRISVKASGEAVDAAPMSASGRSKLVATSRGWAWLERPDGSAFGLNLGCIVPLRQRKAAAKANERESA